MKAFVTGATGFIGSHLVHELCKQNFQVVCLVRNPVQSNNECITCIPFDLLHADLAINQIKSYMVKGDVLFHIAAVLPNVKTEAHHYLTANAVSSSYLAELAAEKEASFVYISSLPIIGKPEQVPIAEDHPLRPGDPYLCSKLCGEMVCEMIRRSRGSKISSLRISSPYGPGMNPETVLPKFIRQTLSSQEIHLFGTGRRTQNFIHVDDIISACLLAANTDQPAVYNIAGPSSISMHDLANLVVRLIPESKSNVSFSNMPDPQDDYRWEIDLTKAKKQLGYSPGVPIFEGLLSYISWVKSGKGYPKWWQDL